MEETSVYAVRPRAPARRVSPIKSADSTTITNSRIARHRSKWVTLNQPKRAPRAEHRAFDKTLAGRTRTLMMHLIVPVMETNYEISDCIAFFDADGHRGPGR